MAYQWVDLTRIEEFSQSHTVRGTQKHLFTYLADLHNKSKSFIILEFRFGEEMPNLTL